MIVGFVHTGSGETGISRFGRLVAGAVRAQGVEVIEATTTPPGRPSLAGLLVAARQLSRADVIHVQYDVPLWGGSAHALLNMGAFAAAAGRPLVLTAHETYGEDDVPEKVATFRVAGGYARRIVAMSKAEIPAMARVVPEHKIRVIPHYVDRPAPGPEPRAAREALGLTGRRVVTVLGWTSARKGQHLAVEAMKLLPDDVFLLIAGGAMEILRPYMKKLRARIADSGLSDRVRITGFVPWTDMPTILAATHLGLCPFQYLAASGTVSQWIGAAHPVLVSDLPALREYDAIEPGALWYFPEGDVEAMARAIAARLPECDEGPRPSLARLADSLSLERTAARYIDLYRETLTAHADGPPFGR